MMKSLAATAIAALVLAAPASAESLMVIGQITPTRAVAGKAPNAQDQLERAVDNSCAQPFFRDLKGREIYRQCRSQVLEQMTGKNSRPTPSLALR